ncbi:MAG TPA: amidohydrolase family protein [Bryobacteraceae bacterium]
MKKKRIAWITAAALLVTAGLEAEVPSAIAIQGARVVTVSGPELAHGTVLVRDGLIEQVGEHVAIPPEAWVINGAGLTVYPGFIDALSTWGIPAPAPPTTPGRAAGAGGTPPAATQPEPRVKGPEDRPQTYAYERAADLVNPSDKRLEAARAAGFTTSATFPNRGIVEGLGALVNLAGERGRDMVVAQPIGEQIIFRVGGGPGRSFPSSLMGNIAYVRQLYLDVAQYREAKQIYAKNAAGNRRPEYDHALEALSEAPRLLLPAQESQQIERILRFGRELKTPFVVYGAHEAYRSIDELKQAQVPVLVSLKWPEKPKNADPSDLPNARDLEMRERAPAVPAMLAKAGVRFAFYSDGVDSAPDLKKALRKALDAGLSRADTIKALTWNAAEIYGATDRLGSIDKGKIANLTVTRGDAFEDQTTVEYVVIDGKLFEPSKDLQKPAPKNEQPKPTEEN